MKFIPQMLLYSAAFSVITLGSLTLIPYPAAAQKPPASISQEPSVDSASVGIPAVVGGPTGVNASVFYAPKDVVDMTRLVLETSRDQTTHLAHYIERATTIVVIFFTLLGAAAAVFGLRKLQDVEAKVNRPGF